MATINFQSYPYSTKATFKCVACGKGKCSRTFKSECTRNPFNKNPDGSIRTAQEVAQQSKDQSLKDRAAFLTKPYCAKCEASLRLTERIDLHKERSELLEKTNG